jgi:hypothetical protein
MAGASESSGVARWIYATLTGNAGITAAVGSRVYEDQAPEQAGTQAYPVVVFTVSPGPDAITMNSTRVWATFTALIKVVDQAESYGAAEPVAKLIDQLFHKVKGAATGATIYRATRTMEVRYAELDQSGRQFRHLGGLFRLIARAA